MTWMRIKNDTGSSSCPYCADEGWCLLIGTIKVHGYEYSRGSAPCKWCEIGLKRWARMKEKRVPVDDSYTTTDVDMPTPDDTPLPKHEAKRLIADLMRQSRPPIVEKTETSGDIKKRIDQARDELATPPPQPAEPEPFTPAGDDIPF